jgi:hypothetical protein
VQLITKFRWGKVMSFFTSILLTSSFLFTFHPLLVSSPILRPQYNCNDHCYGIATTNISGIRGVEVDMDISRISCNCYNPSFVDNEVWLEASGGLYWVEVGYSTYSPTSVKYFWADFRPGSVYHEHNPSGNIPSNDYGTTGYFQIYPSGTNAWFVLVDTQNTYWYGYSTSNTMSPSEIQMGQELAGTSGESAPYAAFTQRYYINQNLDTVAIGSNRTLSSQPPACAYNIYGTSDLYTQSC